MCRTEVLSLVNVEENLEGEKGKEAVHGIPYWGDQLFVGEVEKLELRF